jgi:very-short-patch-repair endonuclease
MVHQARSVSSHRRKVLRQRARRMRHEPSHTEWLLWQELRCRKQGVVFRRQVVLQGYIADFYASSAGLIVEVDGGWHATRSRRDARRDRVLGAAGYRVLRVTAEEVLHSLPTVVAQVRAALAEV